MDKEQVVMDATNFWENAQIAGKPVDLLSFFAVFVRRWPFLLLMTMLGFCCMLGISFLLTPQFTAHAVFLPPPQQSSASDNPLAFFLRPPSSTVYSGLLTSDSVLTDVIEHTNLQAIYKVKDMEQARQALRSQTAVSTDQSGFVSLQVTNKSPQLARDIATNYLAALRRLNDRMAISEAEQHRQLFQTEFERAKDDLERSEVELKKAQEASGVVSPETQTRSGLSAIDTARADIRAKRVALAALLQSQTEQSPEVQRARSEIAAEEAQLGGLENGAGAARGSGLTAAQAPSVNLRFVELDREVKYNQVLFDVMAKQYENARLQESSAAPAVQVVDAPELPLHKSKPSHTIYALAGLLLGLFGGMVLVFARNRLQVLERDPERAAKLRELTSAATAPSLRP